jgi:hypothetical protein
MGSTTAQVRRQSGIFQHRLSVFCAIGDDPGSGVESRLQQRRPGKRELPAEEGATLTARLRPAGGKNDSHGVTMAGPGI